MENISSNSNAIKSPEPNIVSKNKQNKPKRTIKRPKTGVLATPNISNTPIADTLTIKKQENPQTRYKLTSKKYSLLNLSNILSVLIFCCGFCALSSYTKNIFNFIKKLIKK